MKDKAINYHNQGNSCAESIIKAAIEKGYCRNELYNAACSFAGGMNSGCLCGAIAASVMVLGDMVGKDKAKQTAKIFINKFKENHKATCCRVLSAGLEGQEKRKNCNKLVEECAEILEEMVEKFGFVIH